jgi:3-isopropylmalate/(R)-2-methylmalate dehydratase small subunit
MTPFQIETGMAAPLMRPNIDTDVIIRIERLTQGDRKALGPFALEALRYRPDGGEDPDCVLNQPKFRGAPILITGANFGCGSSREGAVTALIQMGLRCIIAESFGDIFYSNCFQNGLLPIRLDAATVGRLAAQALACEAPFAVDLVCQEIISPTGEAIAFSVDPMRRDSLLAGLDDTGMTLRHADEITAWQAADRQQRPWIWSVTG